MISVEGFYPMETSYVYRNWPKEYRLNNYYGMLNVKMMIYTKHTDKNIMDIQVTAVVFVRRNT